MRALVSTEILSIIKLDKRKITINYSSFLGEKADAGDMKELTTAGEGGGQSWVFYFGVTFGLVTVVGCGACIFGLFCVAKSS